MQNQQTTQDPMFPFQIYLCFRAASPQNQNLQGIIWTVGLHDIPPVTQAKKKKKTTTEMQRRLETAYTRSFLVKGTEE